MSRKDIDEEIGTLVDEIKEERNMGKQKNWHELSGREAQEALMTEEATEKELRLGRLIVEKNTELYTRLAKGPPGDNDATSTHQGTD